MNQLARDKQYLKLIKNANPLKQVKFQKYTKTLEVSKMRLGWQNFAMRELSGFIKTFSFSFFLTFLRVNSHCLTMLSSWHACYWRLTFNWFRANTIYKFAIYYHLLFHLMSEQSSVQFKLHNSWVIFPFGQGILSLAESQLRCCFVKRTRMNTTANQGK